MHHRLFSSSFLFMITLFMYFGISSSLSQNGDNRFNECSLRFECGLNKNITYPFWGNGRFQDCGRPGPPGFELKNCQDDNPVIEIMEEEYRLLSIDQDKNILTIVRLDIWDDDGACPDKFVDISLHDSLFNFSPEYHNLTFLYNCSPQFSEPTAYKVTCSINGSSHEGFYVKEPAQNLQIQSCKDIVRVPVLRSSLKDLHRGLNIQKVLKKGFNVTYKYDEHACSACDKSGGQCGYNWTAHYFMCLCPDDQPTSWECSSDTSKTGTQFPC